ncbi:nucleoside hydrolase [Dyadobacter bucti]|uniref:nucleoside hydrolase n=1 Tax=Dyadobacter bucti TaxID=2572203 RepID=UPI001109D145|nr:nucleoside hydrolase [Dyadobacter bucti]
MYKILIALLFTISGVYAQTGGRQVKSIILDTDIGPDYDDVGAMAVMHALADRGEARPLAVIASNKNELVVPTIEILNTFFGRPELPTGAPKGEAAPSFGATQKWPEMLVEKYPHKIRKTSDAPAAVETYRKVLAKQPDQSVTIITIGFLTNLADLLDSEPDAISPLSGVNLVRKKVQQLVSMAGGFPSGWEYNVRIDSVASEKVFSQWPTEILFSGFEIGNNIKTGLKIIADEKLQSPVKEVYALSIPKSKGDADGRMSWDQTAVLVGIRGVQPYFGLKRGKIIIEGGSNKWQDDPMGPHAYLTESMPVAPLTSLIEGLMMWEGKK